MGMFYYELNTFYGPPFPRKTSLVVTLLGPPEKEGITEMSSFQGVIFMIFSIQKCVFHVYVSLCIGLHCFMYMYFNMFSCKIRKT